MNQFFRQMTPDLSNHSNELVTSSLHSLFDRIGQGILVTHSAGGFPGWLVAAKNPDVRAVVSYEPGNYIFPEGEVPESMPSLTGTLQGVGVPMDEFLRLTKIPIILYFGDYIPEVLPEDLDADDITTPGRDDDDGIDLPDNANGVEAWLRRIGIVK